MIHKPTLEIERIENAVIKLCNKIDSEGKKKVTWQDYSEEQLWSELVSCILGSRVLYETAKACTKHLRNSNLIEISIILNNPEVQENKLIKELSKPIFPPFNGKKGSKYRFPCFRSKHIVKTAIEIYHNSKTSIKNLLEINRDANETRYTMIKKCHGIGPKQASLFLRNISYCDNLAILDSHVIRYIKLLRLKENSSTYNGQKCDYFLNENILSEYAKLKKKSLATLDFAIWVVMSLIYKEFSICQL